MKRRVLIIDDERPARKRLERLLEAHSDSIDIVGEASDGLAAVESINKLEPDVVFLDIEMPGIGGFAFTSSIFGAKTTVKPLNNGDIPAGLVTVTCRIPTPALDAIKIVTGSVVSVPPFPMAEVTPVPLKTTAVAPLKFVPVTVADTLVP